MHSFPPSSSLSPIHPLHRAQLSQDPNSCPSQLPQSSHTGVQLHSPCWEMGRGQLSPSLYPSLSLSSWPVKAAVDPPQRHRLCISSWVYHCCSLIIRPCCFLYLHRPLFKSVARTSAYCNNQCTWASPAEGQPEKNGSLPFQ